MKGKNVQNHDYLLRFLVIGDSGVGKSALLLRFADNIFTHSFITTIGVDFKIKTLEIKGKIVKIQIWDTAGQERFQAIIKSYFRQADGVVLTYDVTDIESFDNVKHKWMDTLHVHVDESVPKILVGNKIDLKGQRQIPTEEAKEFAVGVDMNFIEASAKTGENVDNVFTILAEKSLEKCISKKNQNENLIRVNEKNANKNNSKCCE